MSKKNIAAFPFTKEMLSIKLCKDDENKIPEGHLSEVTNHEGMDLRDYFAIRAMKEIIKVEELFKPSYIESSDTDDIEYRDIVDCIAKYSYHMADAMIKARERNN